MPNLQKTKEGMKANRKRIQKVRGIRGELQTNERLGGEVRERTQL